MSEKESKLVKNLRDHPIKSAFKLGSPLYWDVLAYKTFREMENSKLVSGITAGSLATLKLCVYIPFALSLYKTVSG